MAMEKSCDTCLFCTTPMPDVIVCIAGKRVREYYEMKTDCKKWVEDTSENLRRELDKLEQKLIPKRPIRL